MAVYVAKIVDDGFVIPGDAPASQSASAFRQVRVDGVDRPLQFFRVQLTDVTDHGAHVLVVVCGHHPRLEDSIVAALSTAITKHFGQPVTVTLDDLVGRATAVASDTSNELAAAAVALVKASAGWDESVPMAIDVADEPFDVFMEFRDRRWFAQVCTRQESNP